MGAIQPGAKGWRGMRGDGADPMVPIYDLDGSVGFFHDTRTADGLAGRLDDRPRVAATLVAPDGRHRVVNGKRQDGSRLDRIPMVTQSLPTQRVGTDDNDAQGGFMVLGGRQADDPLLPPGLDSHRYRTIGNGVVAPVAEWIGRRLAAYLRGELP